MYTTTDERNTNKITNPAKTNHLQWHPNTGSLLVVATTVIEGECGMILRMQYTGATCRQCWTTQPHTQPRVTQIYIVSTSTLMFFHSWVTSSPTLYLYTSTHSVTWQWETSSPTLHLYTSTLASLVLLQSYHHPRHELLVSVYHSNLLHIPYILYLSNNSYKPFRSFSSISQTAMLSTTNILSKISCMTLKNTYNSFVSPVIFTIHIHSSHHIFCQALSKIPPKYYPYGFLLQQQYFYKVNFTSHLISAFSCIQLSKHSIISRITYILQRFLTIFRSLRILHAISCIHPNTYINALKLHIYTFTPPL